MTTPAPGNGITPRTLRQAARFGAGRGTDDAFLSAVAHAMDGRTDHGGRCVVGLAIMLRRVSLYRALNVAPGELRALLWAFIYFYAILCSYYVIRPLRDEMGIQGGVENLQWRFLGTFLAMLAVVPLFGWLTSRMPRRRFLPIVYGIAIVLLLLFYAWFASGHAPLAAARAFYVWVSVFNLFVVSVFWSFMAEVFSTEQAKRLFGVIAAGGSAGALSGPLLTAGLVERVGTAGLLPIAAACLAVALLCIARLASWERATHAADGREPTATADTPLAGGLLDGIRLVLRSRYLLGICLLILLYSTLSTFLYFQQAEIMRDSFSEATRRTQVFALMDFAVNSLTLTMQVFFTGRLVRVIGIAWCLAIVPLLLGLGLLGLAYAPVLAVLVCVQVLRRAGNYAVMRPAREMLYVVLAREEKYKAKNFIDTAVYRGGDALSAWVYEGFRRLGLELAQIALLAVPLAGLWAWVAFGLGKKHDHLAGRGTPPVTAERSTP